MSHTPVVAAAAVVAGPTPTITAAAASAAAKRLIVFLLMTGSSRSDSGPALVRRRGAGPQQHGGAVRGPVVVDVQAQPGRHAAYRAVGAERPLLVGAAGAVPQLGLHARGGAGRRVEALAERLDGLTAERPALVGAAVAVPDDRLGAVGGGAARYVEASSRRGADQRAAGSAGRVADRAGHRAQGGVPGGGHLVVSGGGGVDAVDEVRGGQCGVHVDQM